MAIINNLGACTCSYVIVDPPGPCVGCDNCDGCLQVASVYVPAINSLPCASALMGTVDLSELNNYTVCGDEDVIEAIVSAPASNIFDVLTFEDKILTFSTGASAVPNQIYTVRYQVSCPSKGLSVFAEIKIAIKDACLGVVCAPGETCNSCTGLCE